jgi:tetratricopeptide (TPR) repeat protein
MMGIAMEHTSDYSAALEAYSRALVLQQDFEDTWYFLNNNAAFCLNQLGRYGEAEKYCRIAIRIEPRRHNAYKNLGVSLQNQCLYAEAARNFIRAIKLCPTDRRALDHLKELINDHPEVIEEIPDLWELLESNGIVQEAQGEFRLQ